MTVSCWRNDISVYDILITFVAAVSSHSDGRLGAALVGVACKGSWAEGDDSSHEASLPLPSSLAGTIMLGWDDAAIQQIFNEGNDQPEQGVLVRGGSAPARCRQ